MTAAVADLHTNRMIQGQISLQVQCKRSSENEYPVLDDPFLSLPRLLALPLELHQAVILYLTNSGDPGLADLRAVNRFFYSIITSDTLLDHGIALVAHRNLKTADRLFEVLEINDKLPCSLCLSLIPAERFHWNSRRKALGSKRGYTRFYCSVAKLSISNNIRFAIAILSGILFVEISIHLPSAPWMSNANSNFRHGLRNQI